MSISDPYLAHYLLSGTRVHSSESATPVHRLQEHVLADARRWTTSWRSGRAAADPEIG